MNRNPQEQPFSEEYEDGFDRLNAYFEIEKGVRNVKRIERLIYKYTECGAWISIEDDGIKLGSIVEGCGFGTQVYPLKWSDVTNEAINVRIDAIEKEADALWKWANESDRDCDAPHFPEYDSLDPDGRSS